MVWAPTFGEVSAGDYLLLEDSYGRLSIAQNQGSAAETLPVEEGAEVVVRRAPAQATE
jgi:S-adenosylmethionine hydrolase